MTDNYDKIRVLLDQRKKLTNDYLDKQRELSDKYEKLNTELDNELRKLGYFSGTAISKSKPVMKPIVIKPKQLKTTDPAPKSTSNDKPKIDATVAQMKAFLTKNKVEFKSTDKRADLESLIRKHNLVRKCEQDK